MRFATLRWILLLDDRLFSTHAYVLPRLYGRRGHPAFEVPSLVFTAWHSPPPFPLMGAFPFVSFAKPFQELQGPSPPFSGSICFLLAVDQRFLPFVHFSDPLFPHTPRHFTGIDLIHRATARSCESALFDKCETSHGPSPISRQRFFLFSASTIQLP